MHTESDDVISEKLSDFVSLMGTVVRSSDQQSIIKPRLHGAGIHMREGGACWICIRLLEH